jgi:hypothetical protein
MPTATYIALGNITLTGNEVDIEFASIPATYRDLVLVYQGTNSNASAGMEIYLNNDTGNRSWVWMINDGTVSSGTSTVFNFFGTTDLAASILHIMDYSATDKHKTLLWRDNVIGAAVRASAGRWASTAAVTSVKIARTAGQTIQTGSTFSLFGIVS